MDSGQPSDDQVNIENNQKSVDSCENCNILSPSNAILKTQVDNLQYRLENIQDNYPNKGANLLKRVFNHNLSRKEQDLAFQRKIMESKEKALHQLLETTAKQMEADEQSLLLQISETRKVLSGMVGQVQQIKSTTETENEYITEISAKTVQEMKKETEARADKERLEEANIVTDLYIEDVLQKCKARRPDETVRLLRKEQTRLRKALVEKMETNTDLMVKSKK